MFFCVQCFPPRTSLIITVRKEVAKVIMFLHLSVILFGGGVCYPSMHCRWYPSMPCSRGACSGGCLLRGVPASGGACFGGVPAPGGCLLGRVCSLKGACWGGGCLLRGMWRPPDSRRLLLRTVRIPLECILVANIFPRKK